MALFSSYSRRSSQPKLFISKPSELRVLERGTRSQSSLQPLSKVNGGRDSNFRTSQIQSITTTMRPSTSISNDCSRRRFMSTSNMSLPNIPQERPCTNGTSPESDSESSCRHSDDYALSKENSAHEFLLILTHLPPRSPYLDDWYEAESEERIWDTVQAGNLDDTDFENGTADWLQLDEHLDILIYEEAYPEQPEEELHAEDFAPDVLRDPSS